MSAGVHVSASQIATWRLCKRKWAYSRTRPRTENKWAMFGSRAHTIAEAWLTYATPPSMDTDEGRCVLAGLGHLPMPGTACVEQGFEFEFDGVIYVGRIDFLHAYTPGQLVIVGDHKTTGDFRYAMTTDTLRGDPQWTLYGVWAAVKFRVPAVAGSWIYYRRKPPKAIPVGIVEPASVLVDRFVAMHANDGLPIAVATHLGIVPEQFPRDPTFRACEAFGGCPYAAECLRGVSPIDRLAATLSR